LPVALSRALRAIEKFQQVRLATDLSDLESHDARVVAARVDDEVGDALSKPFLREKEALGKAIIVR